MPEGKIAFVAGALRSGTTLLRLMLDHHPKLKNTGEFDFLFDFDHDSGAFPDPKAYCDWLSYNRIFLEKNLTVDKFLDYPGLVKSFVEQIAVDEKVTSFNVHRHFDRVTRIFPDAKFVHLLRDPRDVARSSIGMGWAGHVYFGVSHWIETEKSWARLKPNLKPEQYLEITYEQLISDTVETLIKVCDFLGVDYDPALMNYSENSTYDKPDKALIEQWRRKLPPRDVQLLEYRVGDLLTASGYKFSDYGAIKPSALELLKLKVLNKWFVWRFSTERYGVCLFLAEKISRHAGMKDWNKRCHERKNAIDVLHLK